MKRNGFTLIELLVVVTIIALLIAVLLPALGMARNTAQLVSCESNLRQLGVSLHYYAQEYSDYLMPLRKGNRLWWGEILPSKIVDHTRGYLWDYLKAGEQANDVFACPSLPRGSYEDPQSIPGQITSAYGYNGYYLSPPATDYGPLVASKPWQRLTSVSRPEAVFAFGDTALANSISQTPKPRLTAYLDPPFLLSTDYRHPKNPNPIWSKNVVPTNHFRHQRRTNVVCVDGHCEAFPLEEGHLASGTQAQQFLIGYVGESNAPHYIPDYPDWK